MNSTESKLPVGESYIGKAREYAVFSPCLELSVSTIHQLNYLWKLNGYNNIFNNLSGDNYLKPYVSCEPEVTITDRTSEDDFMILASDGLWDVVSNETACGLAKMCLKGNGPSAEMKSPPMNDASEYENCDRACLDASLLLTKLALARRTMDNVSVVVIDLRNNRQ